MQYQITHIEEFPQIGPTGNPAHIVRVTFKVGTFGPFHVDIKKEDFLKGGARQQIEDYVFKVLGLTEK